MALTEDSPKIIDQVVDEGESQAFIPYADLGENFEKAPIYLRADLFYYSSRMGFMPNCNKVYMHVPWIAEHLFHLNNAIMRDERNALNEHLKYRIALAVSRTNECPYCVSHHTGTLKRRWQYGDGEVQNLLHLDQPADEREAVAMEFATQASLDSGGVTDELRAKLAAHFTPQEVMEIVTLIGFWKMYNLMHAAMALPIEDPVAGLEEWMHVQPSGADRGPIDVKADVEIYSKQLCPSCRRAKRLLAARGAAYREYDIDGDTAKLEEMLERTGGKPTVPQIFINGELIGGMDHLAVLDRQGDLSAKLLRSPGG